MFTDMVGYTSMTQADEQSALLLLQKQWEMLRPIIARHNGREVKTIGDALLVEFASALEATQSAVEIQTTLREFNQKSVDKILLRIGIHIGDVVLNQEDVYGDAVNIASRVEPLADSGGICITEQVYAQVRNKLSYEMEKLPRQTLKNVDFPIDVYKVMLQRERQGSEEAPTNRIAVLPLSNISPDPKDAYFAEGMTEELITVLSQVQGLRVIARTSVDHYRGREKRVSQIGQELRVGSVMEGSVRMAGDRLRVTVQLINTSSEEHVWAENYDRRLEDVFAIQSDIARKVADSLKVKLLAREEERLGRSGTENLPAYTSYLKGRTLLSKRKRSELIEAKEQFETAISLDPTYAPAYAGLADAYFLLGEYQGLPVNKARQKATELVSRALGLDQDLAEAHASLGRDMTISYQYEKAEAEFARALALNPSYSIAHMWYAQLLQNFGRVDEWVKEYRLADELDPLSLIVLINECWNLSMIGRREEASAKLQKAVEIDPGSLFVLDGTSFFHYLNGDIEGALKIIDEHPQFQNEITIVADYAAYYSAMKDEQKARAWIQKLLAFPDTAFGRDWWAAIAYAELGDFDNFFLLANRSVDKKEMRFGNREYFPPYKKVKSDPRWGQLLARVNLQP
jgi:TolB-like protein/Flp pilus assembly protein TadD